MVMCFAPDCKHYSEKHGCRFFVFPKDEKEKKIWLKLLRREDREPSKYSLVCSCHFENSDRKNRPTLYEHNKNKINKVSPEQKKLRTKSPVKRSTASADLQSTSSIPEPSTSSISLVEYDESRSTNTKPSTSFIPDNISTTEQYDESRPSTSNTRPETSLSETSELTTNLINLELGEENRCQFIAMTEAENYMLSQQVKELTEKLNKLSVCFSWEHIEKSDKRILMYTGLPNKEIFMSLYKLMNNFELKYYYGWNVLGVSKINQLLLTLMKLRLNLHHEDLACRFNISRTTVSNIILTWCHALHEILNEQLMEEIPSRQKNKLCAPTAFNCFANCRIIIDCTEISATTPTNMEKQQLTYSSYKHKNTLKGLIGVAPNGVCTFVSKLYPGSTSDKKIFAHCGLREKLVPGDLVLADKGFLIADLLPDGVTLNNNNNRRLFSLKKIQLFTNIHK